MNKIIKMQYPYDYTKENNLFDGKFHDITVNKISKITIRHINFFIIDYYDLNVNYSLVALTMKIQNKLVHVPVDNYDLFYEYINGNYFETVDIENFKLQDNIYLAETIEFKELINNENRDEPELTYHLYVPVSSDKILKIKERIFFYSNKIQTENTIHYIFSKSPYFNLKEKYIQEYVQNYLSDNINEYEFRINVLEGTRGVISSINNGYTENREVYIIPGIHKYKVTYAKCNLDDYKLAKSAELISITGEETDSIKKIFIDGFNNKNTKEFYTVE